MWTRRELKDRAKDVLRKSYWKAFLVSLIIGFSGGNSGGRFNFNWNMNNNNFTKTPNSGSNPFSFNGDITSLITFITIFAVVFIIIMLLVIALRIFLGYALEVGGRKYFINSAYNIADLNNIGYGFQKETYSHIVKSMFLKGIYNFLWFLLFLIPGIVKAYAYRMVPYILADNPKIGPKRAIELSNKMTSGQKFDMFVLDLSFLGWYILGFIALVIGMIFVMPYEHTAKAELYLVLRENALKSGICTYDELNLVTPIALRNDISEPEQTTDDNQ